MARRPSISRHVREQVGFLGDRVVDMVDAVKNHDTDAMRQYAHNIQYHAAEILDGLPGPTLADRMSEPAESVVPSNKVVVAKQDELLEDDQPWEN